MHIVVQLKHLLWERRIIGQYARRIVIHVKSVFHTLHNDRTILVRNDPMQLCARQLLGKRRSDQIHLFKMFSGFRNRCTL